MKGAGPGEYFATLPKAELHLHLEGTLEPEMAKVFGKRNGIEVPEDIGACYNFSSLQSFLDVYYSGLEVLKTKDDFFDLTFAYLKRAAADNVKHVEACFDPQAHTSRGVPLHSVIFGIREALDKGGAEFDISSKLIVSFLRHLPQEDALSTLEELLQFARYIDGVGLDSSEVDNPPSKFAEVFERCRQLGWFSVAHAGEEGPPSYIVEALDKLKVCRIDHGVKCMDDEALVERLVKSQIPLAVCPISNVKLGVVPNMKSHPLREMLRRGLNVSIHSDDPGYFGAYLNDNGNACVEALGLTHQDMKLLAVNSFNSSHIEESRKTRMLALIKAH